VEITAAAIRALVDEADGPEPVTSVYLATDGAQLPRAADVEARLDGLLRQVRREADAWGPHADGVRADADTLSRWVRHEFDRGDTRGLALFASGGRLLERVESAREVRTLARVATTPYVVPLEALLGRHHHIALALVARDRARVFRYRLGRLEEHRELVAEVHGQHEQGGWAQARYQRTIEEEKLAHMKDVAERLRALHDEDPLDVVVVAGADAEVAEFTPLLHPYLKERVRPSGTRLSLRAGPGEVLAALDGVEQELVSERRSALLERLAAAQGSGAIAARGLRHVLEAANAKRIDTLFVVEGAGEAGFKSASGALARHEHEAAAYGEPVEPVADLLDEVIEEAVRSGAHIELFREPSRLDGHPVAALLRF